MIPFLANSYPFTGNGLGGLSDAIECKVTHEINGEYELSMRYPITGIHYDEIAPTYIIMAVPDNMTQAQPFRIYRITKPLNGVVTVYARHIAYDMMGTIVEPFTQSSLTAAINDLANHCTPATSFTFTTTRSVASQFKLPEPRELWRVLGGTAGSFLDVYGGEWDFNLLTAELKTRLGIDRGVHIRYGKNMTGLEQDASLESTYSGVWPFWYDEESGTLVQISEKYVAVAGSSVTDRVLLLDCTDDFENQPSEQDLRDRANAFITANSVGDPKISWKVSFVQLSQAGEYATQAALEQVMLGDTLHVYYDALGINATARAVKIVYDVLADHYDVVTVGRVKQNLAGILVEQNRETENQIARTKSALEQAIDRSTDFIKNGAGYMRMIYNSSNELVEIVSLDNPDISQAQNVWRWNNGGFGFSSTGYNGTFGLALTQAGEIVANYITAGTLNANVIRAGLLTDAANKNSWNLDTGAFTITDGSINIITANDSDDIIQLNYDGRLPNGYGPVYSTNLQSKQIKAEGHSYQPSSHYYSYSLLFASGANEYVHVEHDIYSNEQPTEIYSKSYTRLNRSGVEGYSAVGIGASAVKQMDLDFNNGLTFYNGSGTQTAIYPADASTLLTGNSLGLSKLDNVFFDSVSSSGTTKSYTLNNGTWLVFVVKFNNTSTTYDGFWIAGVHGTSHLTAILTPSSGSTSVSISGTSLSVTTGSSNMRISVIKIT